MAPKLYYTDISAPSRSVLLTAKALELELHLKNINLFTCEQMSPEFIKINPQHTVPTLDDNGCYLWDSHAINMYLVSKYGKNDSLYPRDPQKNGVVNQRLFFSAGIIQPRVRAIVRPIIRGGVTIIPKEKSDDLIVVYNLLEEFMEGHEYMTGDSLTIADFSIVAPLSAISNFVPIASNKYPRLSKWLNKMQQLPYYNEANQVGSDKMTEFLQSRLS